MVVATTSKEALEKIRPTISDRQKAVLAALKEIEPASNEALAVYLNWSINRVTGRVTELSMKGLVEVAHVGKNQTGHSAKFWRVVDQKLDDAVQTREQDCA